MSDTPIKRFTDIVQGFPLYAPILSRKKVNVKVKKDIYSFYESGFNQYIPINCLYINGIKFDISGATFNVRIYICNTYDAMNR